ncbi:GlsB/YeaQ/YmgE family stress response membrane protein [Maricaulaceae bacterium MS644]
MTIETLLIWLLIGAVAGWLAGLIVKGYGLGLLGNIVVGIIGAFVGGWVFGQLGIASGQGIVGSIIGATVGAVIILLLLRLIRRI